MVRRVPTLVLGEALVDFVCEQPVASFAEAPAFAPHFGGAGANVAVNGARAGGAMALASGGGDDPWGHWLLDRLSAEGVDTGFFALDGGRQTPVAFAML